MATPQKPVDDLSQMLGTSQPAAPRQPGDPAHPHQGKSVTEGGDVPLGEQSNAGPTPSETDTAPPVQSFRAAEAASMRTDRSLEGGRPSPQYKETAKTRIKPSKPGQLPEQQAGSQQQYQYPPAKDADVVAAELDVVGDETGAGQQGVSKDDANPDNHVRLVKKTERDPRTQTAIETEPVYLSLEAPYARMITVDGIVYENTGIEDGFTTYRQPDF